MGKRASALAAAGFLWLFFGFSFMRSAAPTYDEAVHLASGYSYLDTGRFVLNINDHPPLAEMLAALPLLAKRPQTFYSHPDWLRRRIYHYSDHFAFKNKLHADTLFLWSRGFLFLAVSLLLGWSLAGWAKELGGPWAAPAAWLAAACLPVLFSNSALVTTDALAAVLYFCVFSLLYSAGNSHRRFAAAGVLTGLAMAAKFNMILLAPLAFSLGGLDHARMVFEARRAKLPPPPPPWRQWGVYFLCAAAALTLCYGVWQAPLYWNGLAATLRRLGTGRPTYLHGSAIVGSFLGYFPAAFLLKTPLGALALSAAGAWLLARRPTRAAVWAVLPAAAYFAVAMTAKVQIGVRHLLPLFPFMALWIGLAAAKAWESGPRLKAAAAVLAAWALASTALAQPHALAYFNELAGGPAGGHRWLVDSNLDWGQDLKGLARTVSELGNPPIYLSYFGSADPAAYGIRYLPVFMCCNVQRRVKKIDPAASGRVLLAVSATNFHGVYFSEKTLFAWLKSRTPLRSFGHSIFLYDLTGDKEGREKLAEMVFFSTGDPGHADALLLK